MKTTLLLLTCIGLASSAFAGGRSGNGGNAKVCFTEMKWKTQLLREQQKLCDTCEKSAVKLIPPAYEKYIRSVTALDLVEAGTRISKSTGTPAPIAPLTGNLSEMNYGYARVQRISELFPSVPGEYAKGAKKLAIESNLVYGFAKPAEDITTVAAIPGNEPCVIATVLFQVKVSDRRHDLYIYPMLMNHKNHPPLSRAVLRMHENFLAARENATDNTDDVRRLVSDLIVDEDFAAEMLEGSLKAAGIQLKFPKSRAQVVLNRHFPNYRRAVADLANLQEAPAVRKQIALSIEYLKSKKSIASVSVCDPMKVPTLILHQLSQPQYMSDVYVRSGFDLCMTTEAGKLVYRNMNPVRITGRYDSFLNLYETRANFGTHDWAEVSLGVPISISDPASTAQGVIDQAIYAEFEHGNWSKRLDDALESDFVNWSSSSAAQAYPQSTINIFRDWVDSMKGKQWLRRSPFNPEILTDNDTLPDLPMLESNENVTVLK